VGKQTDEDTIFYLTSSKVC